MNRLECPHCENLMVEMPHFWVLGYWTCFCPTCEHMESGRQRTELKARVLRKAAEEWRGANNNNS